MASAEYSIHDSSKASVNMKSNEHLTAPDATSAPALVQRPRGAKFWLAFAAICIPLFLSALEYTAVSTALPTIVHDLRGDDFVWVASAYALAATALQPTAGGLSEIFGRRITLLVFIVVFAVGSAVCGSAKNMNWLVAGRAIQGAGGGPLLAIANIVISDLVTLKERPLYNSILGMAWAIATAIGPLVGGAITENSTWRWLFYLNLPVCGFALFLVGGFLNLRVPKATFRERISRMDWIGNALIMSSSTSCVVALSWGGVKFPWASSHVLAPLIIGICGLAFFVYYEARFAKDPLVPFTLISNRSSLSGYIQTFLGPIVTMAAIYFGPVYAQACKDASPVRSALYTVGATVMIGVSLLATGASIAVTKAYRPQLWIGWVFFVASMAALSTVHADTPVARLIGYCILLGFGGGLVFASAYYPVLAPLPASENAHAMAFYGFCRSFAGVWAVTIGTAILQTQLTKRLPSEFINEFPGGVAIAYSIIPVIPTLEGPFRDEVRNAFSDSLVVLWEVLIGVSCVGLLSCALMKDLPLHTQRDEKWGLEETEKSREHKGNVNIELREPHSP